MKRRMRSFHAKTMRWEMWKELQTSSDLFEFAMGQLLKMRH